MHEWERQLDVDADAVRRVAAPRNTWRMLGSGWDCDAWLADEAVVWRAPRREVGIGALRREAALLPVIAPALPAAVPVPELVEAPGLPPLARHRWVPGVELGSAPALDPAVGDELGRFLRALHDPALLERAAALVPTDPIGRADPARRLPIAHRRLDQVTAQMDIEPLREIVDRAASVTPPIAALCHGDLHVRHVMVSPAGRLSGVIDWGDACRSARAVDLAIATALPDDARRRFLAAYGDVDAATWSYARMLGVMFGAALLAADPAGESGAAARRWLERLVRED